MTDVKDKWISIFIALLLWFGSGCAWAQGLEGDKVKLELTCGERELVPGQTATLRLNFTIAPGYHIYASDPGDIGQPTEANWKMPAGLRISSERWSAPENLEQDGFNCRVYSNTAILEADVDVDKTVSGQAEMVVEAYPSWLLCDDMCQPGKGQVRLVLPVRAASTGLAFGKLATAVGLAFCGGLLLNCMPCVFPVLSLKALELVRSSQQERAEQIRHAWGYGLGVLLSFGAITLILNLLRSAGHSLGWGFQMQSPYFVMAMAFVFVALAFNMLGFYEIGLALTRWGEGGSAVRNSLASGMLAVVAATPCTAPFMGTALGYALTVPWYENLLIFEALGLGLALPLVALTLFPVWQRWLPRPGKWMVTLRQVLAFPLLLTAVYFAWVVDVQTGPYVTAAMLAGWVLLGISAWLYGNWGQRGSRLASASALLLALLGWAAGSGAFFYQQSRTIDVGNRAEWRSVQSDSGWETWSPEAVQAARKQGRAVFIDFGAAWCLTCQANEGTVLADPRVLGALHKREVALFKADWTSYDARITKALEEYGRSGVPLYVYYAAKPDAQPQLLPELLSVEGLLGVLEAE